MRSEPQNIGLAFDVLNPKLSCLIRFHHLIFQTNVVHRVNQKGNFFDSELKRGYDRLLCPKSICFSP